MVVLVLVAVEIDVGGIFEELARETVNLMLMKREMSLLGDKTFAFPLSYLYII